MKQSWNKNPDFVDENIKSLLLEIFDEPLSALETNIKSVEGEQECNETAGQYQDHMKSNAAESTLLADLMNPNASPSK